MKKTNYEFGKGQKKVINTKANNALLIDPKTETVTEFHMNNVNDINEMKKLIDCEHFELAVTIEDLHTDMFCDEEGWYSKEETYAFEFDGVIIPSKVLVIGFKDNGMQAELNEKTINELKKIFTKEIKWKGQVTEDDMPQPQVFSFEDIKKNEFFAALLGLKNN